MLLINVIIRSIVRITQAVGFTGEQHKKPVSARHLAAINRQIIGVFSLGRHHANQQLTERVVVSPVLLLIFVEAEIGDFRQHFSFSQHKINFARC